MNSELPVVEETPAKTKQPSNRNITKQLYTPRWSPSLLTALAKLKIFILVYSTREKVLYKSFLSIGQLPANSFTIYT